MRNVRFEGMLVLAVAAGLAAAAPSAAAPGWVGPLTPSSPDTDNTEPQVGIDAQGNTLSVWSESSGSSTRVMAAERPAGGSFGTPFQISREGVSSGTPVLSVSPSGAAAVVWFSGSGVEFTSRAPGGSFAAATMLDPGTGEGNLGYANTIVDSHDRAVVVWQRFPCPPGTPGGCDAELRAAEGPAGSAPTRLAPVTTSTSPSAGSVPQLGTDAVGDVDVTFKRGGATTGLRTARRAVGASSFGAETDVSVAGAATQIYNESMAVAPSGEVVFAWIQFPDAKVLTRIRSADGAFTAAPAPVSDNFGGAPFDFQNTDVAIAPSGAAIATWARDAGGYVVEASVRAPGGEFGPGTGLLEAGHQGFRPHARMLPSGTAVVLWEDTPPSGDHAIVARLRPPSGAFGEHFTVSGPPAGGNARLPALAVGVGGDGIAAWQVNTGPPANPIKVAGLDAAGPQLRSLQAPSTGTAGAALSFSVAPVDTWSPVASTRWSFGDGPPGDGRGSHPHIRGARKVHGLRHLDRLARQRVDHRSRSECHDRPGHTARPRPARAHDQRPRILAVALPGCRRHHPRHGEARASWLDVTRDAVGGRTAEHHDREAHLGRPKWPYLQEAAKAQAARPAPVRALRGRRGAEALGALGANRFPFTGRLGKRVLKVGAYRAAVTGTDTAGNRSAVARTKFTVARR